jgi:hypothetical protein
MTMQSVFESEDHGDDPDVLMKSIPEAEEVNSLTCSYGNPGNDSLISLDLNVLSLCHPSDSYCHIRNDLPVTCSLPSSYRPK